MRAEDAAGAYRIATQVFGLAPATPEEAAAQERRWIIRIEHLLETDAGGAWTAEVDGQFAGVAMALVRDRRLWGLSLLVVDEQFQSRGVGSALMRRAGEHGGGVQEGLITSSADPRAMRAYAAAGFALEPSLSGEGAPDRSALPAPDPKVQEAGTESIEAAGEISRAVRGATHAPDVASLLSGGDRLLRVGDRGYAVHDRGRLRLLAARDEQAARALLWTVLAENDGCVPAEVRWLTARQAWAVDVAVQARLELRVGGPVCVRGRPGPLWPYVPSGSYL